MVEHAKNTFAMGAIGRGLHYAFDDHNSGICPPPDFGYSWGAHTDYVLALGNCLATCGMVVGSI